MDLGDSIAPGGCVGVGGAGAGVAGMFSVFYSMFTNRVC
jgi:hypothetical protein